MREELPLLLPEIETVNQVAVLGYTIIILGGVTVQKQYKIYKIDKVAVDDVMPLLDKYMHERINEYIVAIEYDYLNNGYKKLLEEMSELPVTQYIITTSVFYKLLLYFIKCGIDIYELKLNAIFEEDNDCLYGYIRTINQRKDNESAIRELLELLKWYNYDEGIDISHVTFGMMQENRKYRFYFYNNGVLAIDSEKIVKPVFKLLKDVL